MSNRAIEIRRTVKYRILTQLHRTRYISECKYADAADINAFTRGYVRLVDALVIAGRDAAR